MNNILGDDFDILKKPCQRISESHTQNVTGKVCYQAGTNIEFGGSGNKYAIYNEALNVAQVNAYASKEILLSPGFEIVEGAQFNAILEDITYDKLSLKTKCVNKMPYINYSKPLLYKNKIYGIPSHKDTSFRLLSEPLKVNISPNPVTDFLNIFIQNQRNLTNSTFFVYIFDVYGKLLYTTELATNVSTLDVSNFASGLYICKISISDNVFTTRFFKN